MADADHSAACECACHRKGWFHADENGMEKPCRCVTKGSEEST